MTFSINRCIIFSRTRAFTFSWTFFFCFDTRMEANDMAAFDKVKSGYPGMDDILDYIRMGDNVVWQVTDIDEFRFFALPFVAQAKQDGRSITYMCTPTRSGSTCIR